MNFPPASSEDDRNKQVVNDQSMTVTAPTGTTFVDQQWRDLVRRGDYKIHALALNRDSPNVTTNPWP